MLNILINYIYYIYRSIINNKSYSKLNSKLNILSSENRFGLFSWINGLFLICISKPTYFRLFYMVEIKSDSTPNEASWLDVPKTYHPSLSFPKRRFRGNTCVRGSWLPQTLKNTSLLPQSNDSVLFQKDSKKGTSLCLR